MERYFILDKFNTWYDWRLICTSKDVTPPEPKTNYVDIDGMSGSLDLSESLSGEITYKDRSISATFWTDEGTRTDREKLIRDITVALHGKKIKIIEPDDPTHYFYGRVTIKATKNILPYAEISIEATCDPWRYAIDESVRKVDVNDSYTETSVVINNDGVKTVCPIISVSGKVKIIYNGTSETLSTGTYQNADIKLRHGVNIIGVSGVGSVAFTYREADL